jgi:hypothetical protein
MITSSTDTCLPCFIPDDMNKADSADNLHHKGLSTSVLTPPCCNPGMECKVNSLAPIPALVGIFTPNINCAILIDSGCLQSSVISRELAMQLQAQGAALQQVPVTLRPGVGDFDKGSIEAHDFIECLVQFNSPTLRQLNGTRFIARAIVVDKVNMDYNLIIGLPSIQSFNLTKILHTHLRSITRLCEVCSHEVKLKQDSLDDQDQTRMQTNFSNIFHAYGMTCCNYSVTESEQWQHISDIFEPENDDDEIEEVDIIEELKPYSEELPSKIYGSPELQDSLRHLCQEYNDIFNKALNKIPADVEPLSI